MAKKSYTEKEFVTRAIVKLRKPYRDKRTGEMREAKGIHSVISGFNDAFRLQFDKCPIKATQALAEKGIIEMHPVNKGAMLYLKGEMPKAKRNLTSGKKALEAIL